jgi:hypothetical protein
LTDLSSASYGAGHLRLVCKARVAALVVLSLVASCAGRQARDQESRSPWEVRLVDPHVLSRSSALREHPPVSIGLRVTTVTSAPGVPTVQGKGDGAFTGAKRAAGAIARVPPPDPFLAALGLVLMPVTATGGAIYGAAAAPRDDDRYAASSRLKAALRDTDFIALLRDRVLRRALATPKRTILPVEVAAEPRFDHHLEIAIEGPGLVPESESGFDPGLTLVVGADVCLHRTIDGACLYRRRWVYRDVQGPYSAVAANDAAGLRSALPTAAERLADKLLLDFTVAMQP